MRILIRNSLSFTNCQWQFAIVVCAIDIWPLWQILINWNNNYYIFPGKSFCQKNFFIIYSITVLQYSTFRYIYIIQSESQFKYRLSTIFPPYVHGCLLFGFVFLFLFFSRYLIFFFPSTQIRLHFNYLTKSFQLTPCRRLKNIHFISLDSSNSWRFVVFFSSFSLRSHFHLHANVCDIIYPFSIELSNNW